VGPAAIITAAAAQGAAAVPPTAAPSPQEAAGAPIREIHILPPPCKSGGRDEIVVCGRDDSRERLGELRPPRGIVVQEEGPISVAIPGLGVVEPRLVQRLRPDGTVSQGFMVSLKIPF